MLLQERYVRLDRSIKRLCLSEDIQDVKEQDYNQLILWQLFRNTIDN